MTCEKASDKSGTVVHLYEVVRRFRRASRLLSFERSIRNRIINDPHIAAKFYPYRPTAKSYLLGALAERNDDGSLPVPPRELGWYGKSEEAYLSIGKSHTDSMKAILEGAHVSLELGSRILDFGCGSGSMLRWLVDFADRGEVWGVDISEAHIYWCQAHLSPPFHFATTTSFPHLPFEDGYFDFIYAGSVFTHIADLAESWLLELRRITRPGGTLYLTVHDEHGIDVLMVSEIPSYVQLKEMLLAVDKEIQCLKIPFAMFTINRTPGPGAKGEAQVFYHSSYLRKHWGRFMKVLDIVPEAYGFQSAVLLQKC